MKSLSSSVLPSDLHRAADARFAIRCGLIVLALAVGGFGVWSAMATLSSAIILQGFVKVEDNRKTVQHREGGIVKAILVKEGDYVRSGSTLIVLGDERVAADLDAVAAQLDAETAKAARLSAESTGAQHVDFPSALLARVGESSAGIAMQLERAAFDAKRRALEEQLALLHDQGGEIEQEIEGLQRQAQSKQAATGLMREEVRTHESLSRVGFVSKMQVLRLQRNLQDYEAQRQEYVANAARAKQRRAELATRAKTLRTYYRQTAADELPQARARTAALEQQLRSSRDTAKRQAIVAPISGRVVALKVFTVGGVVAPGAPLLDIVPTDTSLTIEAKLDVDDVTYAAPSMPADVRITAYSSRTAPLLSGELRYVSADRMVDPATGQPYYSAQIAVHAQSLRAAPDVHLQPGMAAEVFLRTGDRTFLQYLADPIRNSMRRALRQPG
jgi:HlyD family type I secretion membrane fusion protein